jgi:outer membrane lipoprotein
MMSWRSCWKLISGEGGALAMLAVLSACASVPELPAQVLEDTEQVAFQQLQQNPAAYEGHRILLGGQVLHGRRLKDRTEIEVLQLPLDSNYQPNPIPSYSQGRFILQDTKDFRDPATIPPGTLLTIVGEGRGSIQKRLDETEYQYPIIESEYMKAWPLTTPSPYAYYPYAGDPYFYGYWPYSPYYYGGYYGPFLFPRFVGPPRRHHFGAPGFPSHHFRGGRHR